jgi:hypothetical protein
MQRDPAGRCRRTLKLAAETCRMRHSAYAEFTDSWCGACAVLADWVYTAAGAAACRLLWTLCPLRLWHLHCSSAAT